MPKQNASAIIRKKRVTFAPKRSRGVLMVEAATRALAATTLSKRKLKGILKKSSYKKVSKSKKNVSYSKKSVRYGLD